jgi:hypothetical protein
LISGLDWYRSIRMLSTPFLFYWTI